jgi:hypothetical protein
MPKQQRRTAVPTRTAALPPTPRRRLTAAAPAPMPGTPPLGALPIGGAGASLSPQAAALLRQALLRAQMARAAQPMARPAPQRGLLGVCSDPTFGPLGYGGR